MTQSYLVTENDNEKLNSNQKVFTWFVDQLRCAIMIDEKDKSSPATFSAIELVYVRELYFRPTCTV